VISTNTSRPARADLERIISCAAYLVAAAARTFPGGGGPELPGRAAGAQRIPSSAHSCAYHASKRARVRWLPSQLA
jgi:hypothetical protein